MPVISGLNPAALSQLIDSIARAPQGSFDSCDRERLAAASAVLGFEAKRRVQQMRPQQFSTRTNSAMTSAKSLRDMFEDAPESVLHEARHHRPSAAAPV